MGKLLKYDALITVLGSLVAVFALFVVVWDYPTVIDAMTPWLALVGPTVAGGLVFAGWRRTHTDAMKRDEETQKRASDREFKNWQRSALADIIAPAIEEIERVRLDYEKTDIANENIEKRLMEKWALASNVEMTGFIAFAQEYRLRISALVLNINLMRGDEKHNMAMMTVVIPECRDKILHQALELVSDNRYRIVIAEDSATADDSATTKEDET